MSPGERQARALEAERFIKHPLFEEGVMGLENAYIKEWRGSHDPVRREECWTAVKVLSQFRQRFTAIVSDGKMASIELEERRNSGR